LTEPPSSPDGDFFLLLPSSGTECQIVILFIALCTVFVLSAAMWV